MFANYLSNPQNPKIVDIILHPEFHGTLMGWEATKLTAPPPQEKEQATTQKVRNMPLDAITWSLT